MRHISNVFLLLIFFSVTSLFAQSSPWVWGRGIGGIGLENTAGVTTSSNGNVLIAGHFGSDTLFVGSDTLVRVGLDDAFIICYDGSGNVMWATSFGGYSNETSTGIATDLAGNVYVTGNFESDSVFFPTDTLINTVTTGNSHDPYLAKFDGNGNFLWAVSGSGSGADVTSGVAVSNTGLVFVTGHFRSTTFSFESFALTNNNTNSSADAYVAAFTSNGNCLWHIRGGGSDHDFSNSIAVDGSTNLYVTGSFLSASMNFGVWNNTNTVSTYDDIFLAKIDSMGSVQWLRTAGGITIDQATDVCIDNAQNPVICGRHFSGTVHFGAINIINFDSSETNGFVAKYDASGNVMWAKTIGGANDEACVSCTADNAGNIFASGSFDSPIIYFGIDALVNATPLPDVFVVKYASTGAELGGITSSGPNHNHNSGIACDANYNVYVTGRFFSPYATFGSDTVYGDPGFDGYIGKLDGIEVNVESIEQSSGISVYPNPFTTITTIRSEYGFENATIQLFNSTGQLISEVNAVNGNQIILQCDGLCSGIYFLEIIQNQEIIGARKLVILD